MDLKNFHTLEQSLLWQMEKRFVQIKEALQKKSKKGGMLGRHVRKVICNANWLNTSSRPKRQDGQIGAELWGKWGKKGRNRAEGQMGESQASGSDPPLPPWQRLPCNFTPGPIYSKLELRRWCLNTENWFHSGSLLPFSTFTHLQRLPMPLSSPCPLNCAAAVQCVLGLGWDSFGNWFQLPTNLFPP